MPPIAELCLVVSGADVVLGLGAHILGRGDDCAVRLDDPLASRRHAAIIVSSVSVVIRDLGSRNGVLVNGDAIAQERALAVGDLVTLGSQALAIRAIRRVGERPRAEAAAVPDSSKSKAIARIVVQRRAALPTGKMEVSATDLGSPTTQSSDHGVARPAGAYHLIAEAAARAFESGRVDRAEKILEAPLQEVLAVCRGGAVLDPEVLGFARDHGLLLCERSGGKHRLRWIDYVQDLLEAAKAPVSLEVADRLSRAMQLRDR